MTTGAHEKPSIGWTERENTKWYLASVVSEVCHVLLYWEVNVYAIVAREVRVHELTVL